MALVPECTAQCSSKELDTADIVREAIFQQLFGERAGRPHSEEYQYKTNDELLRLAADADQLVPEASSGRCTLGADVTWSTSSGVLFRPYSDFLKKRASSTAFPLAI